jgi:glycosyltransferase involved in cell wall biosynthesis
VWVGGAGEGAPDPEQPSVGDLRLWSLVRGSSSDDLMRALHVGLIAPPWVAVPPPRYGGTEVVIDHLARGLVAAGHQVSLFATGDSTCPVEKHWVLPEAVGTTGSLIDELGHVQAAYAQLTHCDVIHDHTLLGPLWAVANAVPIPMVTTNHGEFTPELTALYRSVGEHVAVVAISHHQASTAPTVPVAQVIHHGIDVDTLPVGRGDGGYVVFLGRMHPDKGVHRAIEVARAAGKRLLIAAKMWEPVEHQYYAEQVEPLLGPDAVYLGQVGGADKHDLLAGAEALINPIRWPEPFGLVMIEALAAGTPVLAFPEGAAPEIVDHGRTGFLCRDEADMVGRLATIGAIDRAACRHAAESRFSTRRMVDDHIALYQRLTAAHRSVLDLRGPRPARRGITGSGARLRELA